MNNAMNTELFHGIKLSNRGAFPQEITPTILERMKSFGNYKADYLLGETLELSPQRISHLRKVKGGYRLYKIHVEKFIEKHPEVPIPDLFKNSADPQLNSGSEGDSPPEKGMSPPDIPQPLKKSRLLAEAQKKSRLQFIVGIQNLTGKHSASALFEILPQYEQQEFINIGVFPEKWLGELKKHPGWEKLFTTHSVCLETRTLKDPEPEEYLKITKPGSSMPEPEQTPLSPKKHTSSSGTQKEAAVTFSDNLPGEIVRAIFKASFLAGRVSHLKAETENFLGSLVKSLSNWTIQHNDEGYVLISKNDQVFRVNTRDFLN